MQSPAQAAVTARDEVRESILRNTAMLRRIERRMRLDKGAADNDAQAACSEQALSGRIVAAVLRARTMPAEDRGQKKGNRGWTRREKPGKGQRQPTVVD